MLSSSALQLFASCYIVLFSIALVSIMLFDIRLRDDDPEDDIQRSEDDAFIRVWNDINDAWDDVFVEVIKSVRERKLVRSAVTGLKRLKVALNASVSSEKRLVPAVTLSLQKLTTHELCWLLSISRFPWIGGRQQLAMA